MSPGSRTRPDRCPGVLRPWRAEDGLLVRLRLVGGRLPATTLVRLVALAEEYGDGLVHVTSRANLQLRALPSCSTDAGAAAAADGAAADDGAASLAPQVVEAIGATGLLPAPSHELARNVMVSPQTGLFGGRGDLRPVAAAFDAALCASPVLARLPGRFLFVLDDGRGDLMDRTCDLGLVALSAHEAQLRIGSAWGPVVPLADAAGSLVRLAEEFMTRRGSGPDAAWHVDELTHPLAQPLAQPSPPDPRLPAPTAALPFGPVAGGEHLAVPDGIDLPLAAALAARADELIVTPWRGVLVPLEEAR